MAWALNSKGFNTRMKRTLPGLDNFYMINQWSIVGGGAITGNLSGRNITQVICKKDKKKFITS